MTAWVLVNVTVTLLGAVPTTKLLLLVPLGQVLVALNSNVWPISAALQAICEGNEPPDELFAVLVKVQLILAPAAVAAVFKVTVPALRLLVAVPPEPKPLHAILVKV